MGAYLEVIGAFAHLHVARPIKLASPDGGTVCPCRRNVAKGSHLHANQLPMIMLSQQLSLSSCTKVAAPLMNIVSCCSQRYATNLCAFDFRKVSTIMALWLT